MEKVNFWEIPNCDNMTHSIGPYYDSNNCLMSQFQKSTLKFAWTLFQDHVIMLSKSTVRDGRPCIATPFAHFPHACSFFASMPKILLQQ